MKAPLAGLALSCCQLFSAALGILMASITSNQGEVGRGSGAGGGMAREMASVSEAIWHYLEMCMAEINVVACRQQGVAGRNNREKSRLK